MPVERATWQRQPAELTARLKNAEVVDKRHAHRVERVVVHRVLFAVGVSRAVARLRIKHLTARCQPFTLTFYPFFLDTGAKEKIWG